MQGIGLQQLLSVLRCVARIIVSMQTCPSESSGHLWMAEGLDAIHKRLLLLPKRLLVTIGRSTAYPRCAGESQRQFLILESIALQPPMTGVGNHS
jgi:hypothetical protein